MSILFEQLDGGDPETEIPDAIGQGSLQLRGIGYGATLAELGAAGTGFLRLLQANGLAGDVDPPLYGIGTGSFTLLQGDGYGASPAAPATGEGSFALRGWAYESPDFGRGSFRLYGLGIAGDVFPPPGAVDDAVYVEESIAFNQVLAFTETALLMSRLAVGQANPSRLTGRNSAADEVVFGQRLAGIYLILIEEQVVFSTLDTVTLQMVARAVSRILANGLANSYLDAINVIITGIVFGQLADLLALESVTDSVVASTTLTELVQMVAAAIDSIVMGTTATNVFSATVLVEESLVAGTTQQTAAELHSLVRECISFVTTLHIDNGDYVAWALNTKGGKALSRYTQFPFNSFARIGGKYYGASTGGIFRLGGDTDNGAAINAALRMGLSSLGGRKLKRVPEVFYAITGDGAMFFKVVIVDELTGEKSAAIYRAEPRPAKVVREHRREFGKGLKSVDWDFELSNIDGADFKLETLQFRPLILDRRTRG